MSTRLPNGTRFAVSTSLAAAVAITGLTNAAEAVASASALPAAGDIRDTFIPTSPPCTKGPDA